MKCLVFFCLYLLLFTGNTIAISPITGTATVCAGATTTLSDASPGGTWSSSNPGIGTVGSLTGVVSGITAGVTTISYTTGSGIAVVDVTVNPLPTLSSSLTPPAICDSSTFNYTPASTIPGTTFAWSRGVMAGILNPAGTGVGNPTESLVNGGTTLLMVTYAFTLSASGCTNTQNVIVAVNPTPMLSSSFVPPPVCSGSLFPYAATSLTPGAVFTWNRPSVAGITPATSFGTGSISEYIYNSTSSPVTVVYYYRLGINGCTNLSTESVSLTVDPCIVDVNDLNIVDQGLKIFPNPGFGYFSVEIPETNSSVTISISDMTGRVISTRTAERGTSTLEFDLTTSPIGNYVVKVWAEGQIYREKIVIW